MTDEAVAAPTYPEGMHSLDITDQMGNTYTVHAFPEPPFGIMDSIGKLTADGAVDPSSFSDQQAADALEMINSILNMALAPNDAEMLAGVLHGPGAPGMTAVLRLFTDLLEAWFPDRPTGGSNELPSLDGPTATTSEEPSSPQAATPNPFQRPTG